MNCWLWHLKCGYFNSLLRAAVDHGLIAQWLQLGDMTWLQKDYSYIAPIPHRLYQLLNCFLACLNVLLLIYKIQHSFRQSIWWNISPDMHQSRLTALEWDLLMIILSEFRFIQMWCSGYEICYLWRSVQCLYYCESTSYLKYISLFFICAVHMSLLILGYCFAFWFSVLILCRLF